MTYIRMSKVATPECGKGSVYLSHTWRCPEVELIAVDVELCGVDDSVLKHLSGTKIEAHQGTVQTHIWSSPFVGCKSLCRLFALVLRLCISESFE